MTQPIGQQSLNWRHIIWFLVVWMFLIFLFRGFAPMPSTKEIPYTVFKNQVGAGKVAQITFKGNRLNGKYRQESSTEEQKQPENENSFFQIFQGKESKPIYFQTTKPAQIGCCGRPAS